MSQTKIVRCPVHGYMNLPKSFFENFVDTEVFQRLRDVGQTAIRSLFPSAQHSRFTHSLGVCHLADWAFTAINNNTPSVIKDAICLEEYETPFKIAALLHDCGHSPFSHVLEAHYLTKNYAPDRLMELVEEHDPEFKCDYKKLEGLGHEAQPHELFSAVVFLEFFVDAYEREAGVARNPALVARMITGCIHDDADDERKQAENCLIRLINGPAIDVDKLDYVVRDNWAAGIDAVHLDYPRLLSSLRLDRHDSQLETVFHKSALSVIQSVIRGRNYLYKWIYSHHMVVYYEHILQDAVFKLISLLSGNGDETAVHKKLFSTDVFKNPVDISGFRFYLPTDCDMLSALKKYYDDIPEVAELLSRKPSRIPLWKSSGEFEALFKERTNSQRERLRNRALEVLGGEIGSAASGGLVLEATQKLTSLEPSRVFVAFGKRIVPFSDAVPETMPLTIERQNRFYVYIPRANSGDREKCIDALVQAPVY